ncbi:hypothetical protein [Pseudomonas sp. DC3000-4b1]|uniref:hypothetical protein n=1 Tax=unclassified Pseudomonas TaxID=196821 RepID=UPI003CE723A3
MKAANDAKYDRSHPFQAYRVGREAVYAAYGEAAAMDLANQDYGYAHFSLSDVVYCDLAASELLYSAAGAPLGLLEQQLMLTSEPGYLGSFEP